MIKKCIKTIHFDIDEKALKDAYPYKDKNHSQDNYKNTYRMIAKVLYDEGFERRQYSGYISSKPITNMEATRVIRKIAEKFPWLNGCFQRLDIENVPRRMDMKDIFNDAVKRKQQEIHRNPIIKKKAKGIKRKITKNKSMER